jgi:hypothetical protein
MQHFSENSQSFSLDWRWARPACESQNIYGLIHLSVCSNSANAGLHPVATFYDSRTS